MILVIIWLVVLAIAMVKGGHGAPSVIGLECGSPAYWVATVFAVPFLLMITALISRTLSKEVELKEQVLICTWILSCGS